MHAEEAFKYLIQTARDEMVNLNRRGVEYASQGELDQVHATADQAKKIKALVQILERASAQWKALLPPAPLFTPPSTPAPVIPNDSRRTPPGQRTPEEKFWLPILQTLVELGGKGKAGLVTDRVGERFMPEILNETDYQPLNQRGEIRWRKTAAFARNELKDAGYMSSSSPNGTWEITPEGRKYLANRI